MYSDGENFVFDENEIQQFYERDRHSPPALDERLAPAESPHKRPPNLFLPRQGSADYDRYKQILANTKDSDAIDNMVYHIKMEVIDSLNSEKVDRSDWRGVASRMGVKTSTIEKIEKDYKENPTKKLFQEISAKKTKDFLQVLIQMNRHDVLNIFYGDISTTAGRTTKRDVYKGSKLKNPSQESTPVSGDSSASELLYHTPTPTTPRSPFKDSGTPESADSGMGSTRQSLPARAMCGSFAKQNTDEDLVARNQKSIDFHSSESTRFWHKIPPKPKSTRKEWKDFEEILKKDFKQESQQSQIMRFICYVLKIEPYEERMNKYVNDRDFANLVAWFGPVKSGPEGCFGKIAELIKGSVTYKQNTGPHSFFAGYMSKEDADKKISEEKDGTFLIRFSSSYPESGSFVVVLKTQNGSEHVLLEGNPETGKISYDGKDYNDLITLWRRGLCRGGVSSDRRTSCTTTCPNLPLNAMFKSYGAGQRPPPAFGRGRGRGRGQEQ